MFTIKNLLLTLLLAIISVAANSSPTLSFQDGTTTVSPGVMFAKVIQISGMGDFTGPSLGAFDFDIDFDSSVLRVDRVVINEGSLDSKLDLFGIDHDLGFFSGSSLTPSSVNLYEVSLDLASDLIASQPTEFILGVVIFEALGGIGSTSDLTFTANSFSDQWGNSLDIDVMNSEVHITPIPPSLFMFIPVALVVLKLQRKKLGSV